MRIEIGILLALAALCDNGAAQGFVNLDFELAQLSSYGAGPAFVPVANAISGWTAYIGGVPQTDILYNAVPIGSAAVTLQGTNNNTGWPAIQGKYFVMLWGQDSGPDTTDSAAIGQTGQIPVSALSLVFWGNIGGVQASFNGQPLNFLVTGNTANYNIYAADISAYAGQTGQLLFTDPYFVTGQSGPGMIDNIQFSSWPIHEPSELALAALGTLLFGMRRRHNFYRVHLQC